MQLEREWLSGSSISQSDRTRDIESSDVFLVSEPFVDKPDCTQFFSMKLDYGTLSAQLLKDIKNTLRLKSMAWELSGDYARWDHTHDYSSVEVESLIDGTSDDIKLADVVIDGKYHTIYMKKPAIPVWETPDIGQLKFMTKLNQKDIDDMDFDGWVYPDGRFLDKNRFSSAFSVFGVEYGENDDKTQFAIPKLNHFIKANPCLFTTRLNEYVAHTNGVRSHSHNVSKMNTSQELDANLSVYVTGDAKKGGYAHGGNIASKILGYVTSSLKFTVDNMSVTNVSVNSYSSNIESHPKYNVVPVLMYVGGIQ